MTQWVRMFTTKPDNQSAVSLAYVCIKDRLLYISISLPTYLSISAFIPLFINLFLMC